ncbi:MAG: extracellular solute-binding protein [Planctomycetaceae bacterium]|nr:MAG: extracellular solute-binding protein [Planctomycetaceae bacterium]
MQMKMRSYAHDRTVWLSLAFVPLTLVSCAGQPESEVVVYSALEQEFSAPILSSFHRHADGEIQPDATFDAESTRPAGLVDRLIAERDQPVADLFWNTEILHTIRLQQLGMLKKHSWKLESGYPQEMRSSDGTWAGFAARGRVLLVNRDLLPDPTTHPKAVAELADPKWQGRCAIARPLHGTTATHAAVLRYILGKQPAREWFTTVAENAEVLGDNRAVAVAVGTGRLDWGLTDTDEAIAQVDRGRPVAIVFPDQASDQPGTLRIPNTIAILADAPHPIAAAKLANFLVSSEIEDRLAMGDSAQLPLSNKATHRPRVLPDSPVRWMEVDFEAAAYLWEPWAEELAILFP